MKMQFVMCMFFAGILAPTSVAQSDSGDTRTITALEQKQVELLLKGEVVQMAAAWLPEFTVNNPFNYVVNGHNGPIRTLRLTYSRFTRTIEKIVFRNDIAIVMGSETVIPSGTSDDSGKEINRRFTNFWVKADGKWKMLARHASVVCGN